jgi:predicted transcriptional regulator
VRLNDAGGRGKPMPRSGATTLDDLTPEEILDACGPDWTAMSRKERIAAGPRQNSGIENFQGQEPWASTVAALAPSVLTPPELIAADERELRFRLRDDEEIEHLPPIDFLVEGLIPMRSLVEIHGAPGSGKSFVALTLAFCIGSGRAFESRQVRRGAVVYVAAEGSAGLGPRTGAWKYEHSIAGKAGVYFVTQPVNLWEKSDVRRFVVDVQKQITEPIQLIVIDTFARCFVGGDENSSRDVGMAIANADMIRTLLQCAVLIVHHTGKSGESERGSTAIRGAADVMILVKKDEESLVTLSCDKAKDMPPFEPIRLELKPVEGSCVVTGIGDSRQSHGILTAAQRKVLETLIGDFDEDGAASTKLGKQTGLEEKTYQRTLNPLRAMGYIECRKEGRSKRYTITAAGKDVIGDNRQIGDKKGRVVNAGLKTDTLSLFERDVMSLIPDTTAPEYKDWEDVEL